MIKRLGEHGYWMDHLDYSRTEIALVNSNRRSVIDDKRLRWVPQASTLVIPVAGRASDGTQPATS